MRKQTGIVMALAAAAVVVAGTVALYRVVNPEPQRQQLAAQPPLAAPRTASPPVTQAPGDVVDPPASASPTPPPQPNPTPPANDPGTAPGIAAAQPKDSQLSPARPPRLQPPPPVAPVGPSQAAGASKGMNRAGNSAGPAPQVPAQPGIGLGDPVVPLPMARSALALVGGDAEAEAVWVQAINDPNLPPNARKDLIEDLNEDGFEDLKHLSPDDLPLIQSRIELIEALVDDAMDDVNAAAFAEAYKDLLNMRQKVMGM